MQNDPASAARRVATRFEAAKRAGHTDVALYLDEVVALLPILDAVAAGPGDDERLQRMCEAMRDADRGVPEVNTAHRRNHWRLYEVEARAAIALADAEAAGRREADALRIGQAMIAAMRAHDNRFAGPEWREGKTDAIEAASSALDAAVRAMAGGESG